MGAMKGIVTLLIVLASATACRDTTGPSASIDQTFTLAPGDRMTIDGTATRIRFLGVDGDSRCPADAFCIQGGDAVVRLEVQSGARGTEPLDLHTGTMAPVIHDDLSIALVQLAPYPFSGRAIEQTEYRATLKATHR
jgi:hypothetical protein